MRHADCLRSVAAVVLVAVLGACGNGTTSTTPIDDAGGSGATIDAGVQPSSQTCSGDPSACLFGTAQADGFILRPTLLRAKLYRTFPLGAATELASQIVAKDNTWAFSGLDPWAHYYVQLEPGFPRGARVASGAATRVGPVSVPGSTGAPLAVTVRPVQLDVFEQSSAGSAMQVVAASAHLVEVSEGMASVSILVGATATPMPYDSTNRAYYVQFAPPSPAQATYAVTTSPTTIAAQATWNLVADVPTFVGAIASPPAGAVVPLDTSLTVTWPPQPQADYERVDLFLQGQSVYTSPQVEAQDKTSETIPMTNVATPGSYLLSVAFGKASCPPTADGCVMANTVATEQITVK
ncbi:MAG: hypothetical protein M3O46_04140 [Myxococcota bacterium]|nr:hypothetical protein [Myxococcota bacterium]